MKIVGEGNNCNMHNTFYGGEKLVDLNINMSSRDVLK
jgi:hypothetical protein